MEEGTLYDNQKIIPVDIEAEMKKSFIDYAMSVIIDRALPDVRDGLKPVHRRVLYSMYAQGITPDKAYRKSATTVGEVLGKYHPHGDAAVYDTMVRLAQDFTMMYPLVDGHGNFGSRDGDPPAAMRYTEARLAKISLEMLSDINKDTVDFKPNFDDSEMEPVVLPSRFPNLLVNGSSGIAVGMATNIPPHNLGEVIDGIIAVINNPGISTEELGEYIKGPDFPTGATIVGRKGIRDYHKTGRGRVVVRSKAEIEQVTPTKQRIVVTDLPYQVNKARLVEKIADLVKEKRIEGISDIRDESGRDEPVRIVIELKRDVNGMVILNQLYKHTQMQEAFNVNMVAIVQTEDKKYEPRVINLRQALDYYISHQEDVIKRRTKFDLDKAKARAHILEGLLVALDKLDEVINIIRASKTEAIAKQNLMDRFKLSELQAQAIVDMRLGRLTGLEREKIQGEYADLQAKIAYFIDVLANESKVHEIIKEELLQIKKKYAVERLSEIIADQDEIDIEDLIQKEECVITLTHFGYVKRLPVDTYRSQRRGGKGITGLSTRQEDFVENLFVTSTHNFILFFTNQGRVYRLKAYEIPEAGRQAKGMAIVNLLQLNAGERVSAVIPLGEYKKGTFVVMATKKGIIKKTALSEYENIRKGGLAAVVIKENDELIDVKIANAKTEIVLATRKGMAIRFKESDARPLGRVSQGVMGIRCDQEDEVIGMEICIGENEDRTLLVVTENGFGKRTYMDEYKVQSRSGKGVLTYRVTNKTGEVIGMKLVNEQDDIMLISKDGTIIRMKVDEISILGRATQGVTLMRTNEENRVVRIAKIVNEEDDEEAEQITLEKIKE